MATATKQYTAEEYAKLSLGVRTELVRGEIIEMNQPGFRHGKVCNKVGYLLTAFNLEHDLGHVINNDSGIVTEREPDTIRGADVWFVSYKRLPKQANDPTGYLDVQPELVFEILSPTDRRPDVLAKVSEYLNAGVEVVCVLDPDNQTAHNFFPDQPDIILQADDTFEVPEILPGLSVTVSEFFQ